MVLQSDDPGLFFGGRYATHTHYFREFFAALKDANVDLIFFGMAKSSKHERSLDAGDSCADKYPGHWISELMDKIDASNGNVQDCLRHALAGHNHRAPIAMYYNLQKLAHEFGEYRLTRFRHNQEIAQYIREHDDSVMAIITNDSDFMVYDGRFQYWKAIDVDTRNLRGVRKCRIKLRAQLGLNTKQLQLLSALCGTMYLEWDELAAFHEKIRGDSFHTNYIARLAKYVRESVEILPPNGNRENECLFNMDAVARDVFGDNYTEHNLVEIERVIAQYNLDVSAVSPEQCDTKLTTIAKTQNMFVYKLLTDEVFLFADIRQYDYRYCRSKPCTELVIPLLQKVCGILFENELRRPQMRTICMKYTRDDPFEVKEVPIVYPSGE